MTYNTLISALRNRWRLALEVLQLLLWHLQPTVISFGSALNALSEKPRVARQLLAEMHGRGVRGDARAAAKHVFRPRAPG